MIYASVFYFERGGLIYAILCSCLSNDANATSCPPAPILQIYLYYVHLSEAVFMGFIARQECIILISRLLSSTQNCTSILANEREFMYISQQILEIYLPLSSYSSYNTNHIVYRSYRGCVFFYYVIDRLQRHVALTFSDIIRVQIFYNQATQYSKERRN